MLHALMPYAGKYIWFNHEEGQKIKEFRLSVRLEEGKQISIILMTV